MKIRIELEKKEATTLFNLADKTFKQINKPISSDRAQHIREYIERDKDNKEIVERKAYGEFHANGLCFDFSFNPRAVELVVEFFGNVITSCIAMFMSFMGMFEGIKAMGENFNLKFNKEFPEVNKYYIGKLTLGENVWSYLVKGDQFGNYYVCRSTHHYGNGYNEIGHKMCFEHFKSELNRLIGVEGQSREDVIAGVFTISESNVEAEYEKFQNKLRSEHDNLKETF